MAEQNRCTPEDWREVKKSDHLVVVSCLLDLLHRVEALEARNGDDMESWAAMRRAGSSAAERIGALEKRIEALEVAQLPQPNHPAKPDSSLVERVRQSQGCGNERDARAAIREVSAWLRENPNVYFPTDLVFVLLEKEAEQ
jgi:BMFP domain-containing protein YqiC